MKVLVCGSRTFDNKELMDDVLGQIRIDQIIHGMARGADQMGGEYARVHNIPVVTFPALWGQYGTRAGPIRNAQMLTEGQPDLVVAFLGRVAIAEFTSGLSDSKYSRGTKNMIDQATKAGVPVRVVDYEARMPPESPEKAAGEFK